MIGCSQKANYSMLKKIRSNDEMIEIYLDFEPSVPLPEKFDFSDKERNISLD